MSPIEPVQSATLNPLGHRERERRRRLRPLVHDEMSMRFEAADPKQIWPAHRSQGFAACSLDCIMLQTRAASTEYKCVALSSAPDGELASHHPSET
jgi:hypothetical protein